jgi:hypothetical protein
MAAGFWTVLLAKGEQSEISVILLEESPDGLDTVELCRTVFGPFDTAWDVCCWVLRHWGPRARLPLR